MRTFHTGGVAGLDIMQGLPRVVELFEARAGAGLAQIAEVAGKVSVEETDKAVKVILTDDKVEETSYSFPARTNLFVKPGQKVEPGVQLNEGSLYPAEILAIRGRDETESYIVAEVQRVHRAQGVDINDKHIELIVRQMLKKIRVESKRPFGSAARPTRGQAHLRCHQREVQGQEDEDACPREPVILGITKASVGDGVVPLGRLLPGDDQGVIDAALEGATASWA